MNIVTLRLYKGKETYSKDGKLTSENQLYKISHKTTAWENFKKTIAFTFSNAEVVKIQKQVVKMEEEEVLGKKTPVARYSYEDIDITDELKKEVKIIFKGEDKLLTASEKKIAELEAKIEDITNGLTVKNKKVSEPKADIDPELALAREDYVKVFGKKGHHTWGVEKLRELIENKE